MDFEELVGKHLISVKKKDQWAIIFTVRLDDSTVMEYEMGHNQECCEYVHIEDIIGDLDDLQDATVLMAEVSTCKDRKVDCGLWTFYRIQTTKGHVDFRWHGESNGYYSVRVTFSEIGEKVSYHNFYDENWNYVPYKVN